MCSNGKQKEKPFKYIRHRPEKKLLYKVVANNLETWLENRRLESRSPLPEFVETSLRSYLSCGILEEGFILVSCDECENAIPVAHSCKRPICPSCAAKRSAEIKSHLIDNVLPHVPYRQYVVTFPHKLRFWMATSRALTNLVHTITTKMIASYYEEMAEQRGIEDPVVGGASFLQRFGSALNINVHQHTVIAEGVWSEASGEPKFYHLSGPENEHVADMVEATAGAVIDLLQTKGYLPGEYDEVDRPDLPALLDRVFADSDALTAALFASAEMRIAFGEHAGQKVRKIGQSFGYQGEVGLVKGKRLASANGFTIHADRYIGKREPRKLEKLISYASRGPFSHERLSLKDPCNPGGDLVYQLKTPWHDGTKAIVLTQMEMIEKLAALVPPRYLHQTRYFGAFASASKMRPKIIIRPHVKKGYVASGPQSVERISWSWLLKRTFKLDLQRCLVCHTKIKVENCVLYDDPIAIKKVMWVLGLKYHPPPRRPARYKSNEFVYEPIDT